MTLYQILYWKDMPAQVRVFRENGRPVSRPLPDRFQKAIDARAMREGLHGNDEYLENWHWSEKQERDLPPDQLLDTLLQELDHG